MQTHDEWRIYQKLVLSELERLSETVDNLGKLFHQQNTEVHLMKFKSSFWGSFGGALAVALIALMEWVRRKT